MGTTIQKLQAVLESIKDIKLAIKEKGGTPPIVFSQTGNAIRALKGAAVMVEKDFNFYDYDGTLLHAYTRGEMWSLDELPPLPPHEGLVAQGWTHTLEELQGLSRAIVGATYTTDDGRSRFYLEIPDEAHSEISITFYQSDTAGVTVNWGDAIATHIESGSVTMTHKYSPKSYPAKYLMTFRVNQGTLKFVNTLNTNMFGPTLAHMSIVKKIELGNSVEIGEYGLHKFYHAESITIPQGIKEFASDAFAYCANITFLAIPRGVEDLKYASLGYCYRLRRVAIPETVSNIRDNVTYACRSLDVLVLPEYLSNFGSWNLQNTCVKSLELPNNVRDVQDGLCRYDSSLTDVTLSPSTKLIGSTAFASCAALSKIALPDTITLISLNAFNGCESLTEIHIPTSLKEIKERAFEACSSLTKLSPFPATLTTIGNYVFNGCVSMREYDFTRLKAIPTLGTNAFYGIHADCQIKVPAALYDEWKVATNWSKYAANIVAA